MRIICIKVGEVIVIGENIKIIVSDIDRNKVRLSFDCPKDIVILRSELIERMKNIENK